MSSKSLRFPSTSVTLPCKYKEGQGKILLDLEAGVQVSASLKTTNINNLKLTSLPLLA
jgi:hypothetical protein